MIDTVCLLIPLNKVSVERINWQTVSIENNQKRYVKNPSKEDKNNYEYFPRITKFQARFGKIGNIKIEFSASKLLFKNNLEELRDEDFEELIKTLHDKLETKGLVIDKKILATASVSTIHFSKNIVLENGYTASGLITEMSKIDVRKTFDFSRSHFINDGQSLYAHTKAHEFVIYDKIADLKKEKSRAIDKDQTFYEKTLVERITKGNQLEEVIRFEVRLCKKRKMNEVIEKLGYSKNPTFKDVFSVEMSKKVVMSYWLGLIKNRNVGLFTVQMSEKEVLRSLYKINSDIKPIRAMYLTSLYLLAKDENGVRELRSIIEKNSHERTWYRISKDLREVSKLLSENRVRDWVTQVETKLNHYQPIINLK